MCREEWCIPAFTNKSKKEKIEESLTNEGVELCCGRKTTNINHFALLDFLVEAFLLLTITNFTLSE